MSSPARDQQLTRERALAELVHIVSVRPELGLRALMAAMKGRRAQVTAEQLTDLLSSGRFRAAGAGWVLAQADRREGEPPAVGAATTGRNQAADRHLGPGTEGPWGQPQHTAIPWDSAELADVLDATVEELSHAVWVLAQNEDTAPRWSANLELMHRRRPLTLTSDDLKEVRGQLKAMVRDQQTSEPDPAQILQNPSHDIRAQVADAPPPSTPPSSRTPGGDRQPVAAPRTVNLSVHAPRWEEGAGGCRIYRCAPAVTFGERHLAEELAKMPHGLAILSPILELRGTTHEVDAVVITRNGVVTLEQKDVPQGSAVLRIGPNSAPELDGQVIESLSHAWRQTRLHAQKLATLLKDETTPAIDPGFINAVLSVEGVAQVRGETNHVRLTPTGRVTETVAACLAQRPFRLPAPAAARILVRLGARELSVAELVEAGFAQQ